MQKNHTEIGSEESAVEGGDSQGKTLSLRKRAEEYLKFVGRQGNLPPETKDMATLLHELAVHQVELEMQAQELQRASDELRVIGERYAEYFRLAPVPIVRVNSHGVLQELNLAAQDLFREISGTSSLALALSTLLQGHQAAVWHRFLNRVSKTSQPQKSELILVTAKGTEKFFAITGVLEKNGDILVYFEETTEVHRRSEEFERLAIIAKHTGNAVLFTDADRKIIWVNDAFTTLTGYTFDEVVGKSPSILQGPETDPATIQKMREKLNLLEPFALEILNYHKNGTPYWIKLEVVPLFDRHHRHIGFFSVSTDITAIRNRELQLRTFQTAIEQTQSVVLITDLTPKITWANPAFERTTGYTLQEVLGKNPSILKSGEHPPEFYRKLWEKLNRNETWEGVFQNRRKDGQLYWERATISPIFDFNNKKVGYIAVKHDITEHRKLELAREQSRLLLQRLVDAIPGILCIRDSNGKFLLINGFAASFLGCMPQDAIGKRDEDFGTPPDEAEAIRKADKHVLKTRRTLFLERERLWTPNGRVGWFQTTKLPFEHPESPDGAVLSLSVEITARVEAERRLESLNAELRQAHRQMLQAIKEEKRQAQFITDLTNSLPIAIYYKDRDGHFLDCNPAACALTGYSREELLTLSIAQRDGEEVARLAREEDIELLSGKVPFIRKERWIRHKSGKSIPTILTKAPIHDENGNIIGIVAALLDITELKQLEQDLRAATDKARAASEAKGAFLAIMSHELRTPLTSVVGIASLLAESNLPSELRTYVGTICRASQTLLELIDDILDYSKIENRKIKLSLAPFSLRQTLVEVEELFRCQAQLHNIQLQVHIAPNVPDLLLGDHSRIKQIFLNLLGNAFKFTSSGSIQVQVELQDRQNSRCALRCTVRDTGIGLPEDQIPYLFEPFTQADSSITRRFGGTGLGLAICRELVRLMDGDISARNCPDHPGAEFIFYIWLDEPTQPLPLPPSEKTQPASGSKDQPWAAEKFRDLKVLVAEDNPNNRKVIQLILHRCGIHATFVENGLQALDSARHFPYDLIFLDVQMPIMDGITSAKKILETFQGQPTRPLLIALTANAFAEDEKLCLESGFDFYLAKPITMSQMRALLTQILPNLHRP